MDIQLTYLEKLIRDSERLAIIKDYTKSNKYINKEELVVLLDEAEEESNAD